MPEGAERAARALYWVVGRARGAPRSDFLVGTALTRISHQLTVEARDRPAITSLRLLTVLNVLFKYASAR